jgi:ankyrin repeat protein
MKKLKWLVSILIFVVMLAPVLCLADLADQLTDAAMGNDIQKVNELIGKGADVNAKNRNGLTALECAVWNGHTELVKLLIAKGADVNEQLNNNETALSIARSRTPASSRDEIVKLLIQAGAKEGR